MSMVNILHEESIRGNLAVITSSLAPTRRSPYRLTGAAYVLSLGAAGLLLALWAVIWLPVYIAHFGATLYLYPVFMVAAAGIALLATGGAVVALVSLGVHGRSSRAVLALVVGVVVAVIALPVMWFGGPAPSFTG